MLKIQTRLLAPLLFASCVSICSAQETWGGLRFGMKLNEVKKIMGDRIRESDSRGHPNATEYSWGIKSVTVGEAEGTGTLIFDKSTDKLLRVALHFSADLVKNKDRPCRGSTTPEQNAHILFIINDVSNKLLENYGNPVNDTGWPTKDDILNNLIVGHPSIEGKRIWKSGGQIIEETLFLLCADPIIYVNYKPASREL